MLYTRSGLPLFALVVTFLVYAGDVKDGALANPGKRWGDVHKIIS